MEQGPRFYPHGPAISIDDSDLPTQPPPASFVPLQLTHISVVPTSGFLLLRLRPDTAGAEEPEQQDDDEEHGEQYGQYLQAPVVVRLARILGVEVRVPVRVAVQQ